MHHDLPTASPTPPMRKQHTRLSPARPNKQRQGANLYGRFILIRMAGDLRRQRVCALTILHCLSSQPFYDSEQSAVRSFETQGKLDEKNFRVLVLGG